MRLSERLLTLAVKYPDTWQKIDAERREEVLDSGFDLGLLSEILRFLQSSPEADTEELLIHWSDHEQYPKVLQLARKTLEISADLAASEFIDGVNKLCEHRRSRRRRDALLGLKDNPDEEKFREYWAQRTQAPD